MLGAWRITTQQTKNDDLAYSQDLGFTINNIGRASPDLLSEWARTPPNPQALETHGLLAQDMTLWWQAQLKHYGLYFEPFRKISSMRTFVQRQLKDLRRLSIPRHLLQLESQLQQQQQTLDEPVRDDRSSTLMPPPISDGDGATAPENDAKFVPVDTEPSANTAQDATTPLDIAQPPPSSVMSRKRKASDFFEPEAKRVTSEALVKPSRELSRRDDATPDDGSSSLDSSDSGSTGSPSESRSESPSSDPNCSDSSSSCSPDIDERGTGV